MPICISFPESPLPFLGKRRCKLSSICCNLCHHDNPVNSFSLQLLQYLQEIECRYQLIPLCLLILPMVCSSKSEVYWNALLGGIGGYLCMCFSCGKRTGIAGRMEWRPGWKWPPAKTVNQVMGTSCSRVVEELAWNGILTNQGDKNAHKYYRPQPLTPNLIALEGKADFP